ncbi:hypothetical protein POSPLADRAFT_1185777 [Postia placenta MAD-698-R-SB12]|uniref:Uncharacterized protein n=1 Tax=Postia placenta MAD-698-R-SB12 TaxID=670580 RepID=A0A1X6MN91_9APHY|nr:hypothetical protein POSPLADRAFT_1185777 [Postia placenta MAD-698-R-SB12]OSX57788.1 hypothetical protein POSPLADRAFT_1185777 [Postia placenta MAD-698-R-SB12]
MAVQVASPVRDPIFRRPLSPMSALSALSRPPQPAPSPPRTNRPLPPVPPLNDTDFFSPVRTASPSPSSPVSPKRALPSPKGKQRALEALSPRSRPVSRATFASRRALTHVLKTPRTLENLLVFVPWADFHALVSTCGNFRRELMARPDCRDAILAQFVPGYRHARAVADIYHYRQVAVDFHDVALLVLSQFVPLHKYPLHTLSLCTDSPHTDPSALADRAARLATLSQAHSRFVLLLQALAPRLRFTAGPSSSESSLASPPSSRSNTDGRATPSHAGSSSPRVRPVDPDRQPEPAVPRGTSPHDLHLATSRARAPVLRVFVPCTALDDAALTACEAQLAAAGLWEHLSVGDVVCNLGYVPPAGAGAGTGTGAGTQVWLVFEGTALVPYAPPGPPPVADPLTLPSPFYYAHILPPFADPVFEIALPTSGLGLGLGLGGAELTLTLVPTRVRSPRSPGGWAVVRRYVWIARVPYVGAAGLGRGWRGEWMLEGEGTKEGRQSLLDALGDGPGGVTRRGRWMVVRDKSGGGRVWMKLLVPNVDHVHDITEACESVVDLPPPARTTTES